MTEYECAVCGMIALFKCRTCKKVKYCSRDCQLNHWAIHKKACYSDEEREVTNKQLGEEASLLFDTAANEIIGPGCTLPEGVPKTFLCKIHAWTILLRCDSARLVCANESVFKYLYDAISDDKDTWLRFLSHEEHATHAIHTAYILIVLGCARRMMGDISSAERIMFICYQIIKRIRSADRRYTVHNLYRVEYYNLCELTKNYDICVHLSEKCVSTNSTTSKTETSIGSLQDFLVTNFRGK